MDMEIMNIDRIKLDNPNLAEIRIDMIFRENKYNMFRDYCRIHNKKTIYDLDNKDMEDLVKQKGIGEKKYKDIIEKLEGVLSKDDENTDKTNQELFLDEIFKENKFRMFRKFYKSRNLITLDAIDGQLLIKFSEQKGVGAIKYREVIDRLKKLNVSLDVSKEEVMDIPFDIDGLKQGREKIFEEIKIEDVFSYGKFYILREYCNKREISSFLDMTNENILAYKNQRGIGKKKFEEFVDMFVSAIDKAIGWLELLANGKFEIKEVILDKCKDMRLSDIAKILEINNLQKDCYMRDIQGKMYAEIIGGNKDTNLLDRLYKIEIELNTMNSIDEIIDVAVKELKDNETIVLMARYDEKMTLQETGNILEVTRERSRQIENKAVRKINSILKKYSFIKSLKLMFMSNDHVTMEELELKIDPSNRFIIDMIKENKINKLFYYEPLDRMFFYSIDKQTGTLDYELEEIDDYGVVDELVENIDGIILDIFNVTLEYSQIVEFIRNMGFKIYGQYYSKGKLNYTKILEIFFKHFFNEPVKLGESFISELNKLTSDVFDLDYIWKERNIDSKLRNLEEIILTDRKTFCHIDHLDNNVFLMNKIKTYIESYVKEGRGVISIERIFDKFKTCCFENGIYNKVHLYSLIKYNFDDYYNTSFGNTLTITTKNNVDNSTTEERVIGYIESMGGIAEKKEVGEYFQWKPLRIDNVISNSNKLINFERNKIVSIETLFEKEVEIEEFNRVVLEDIKKGYTTAKIIFDKMRLNSITLNFINRNKINQESTISNIIRKLNPHISGHTNLLYDRSSKYRSVKDVLIEEYPRVVNKKELSEFIISLGYSASTAYIILRNTISDGSFKETSIDTVVPENLFKIDRMIIEKLKIFAKNEMGDEEFLSLTNLNNAKEELPVIPYRWNPYIMKSILEDNGFKSVIREKGDYRYDCVIILREDSCINRFDELVCHVIRNKYEEDLHEQKICEYLVSLNLLKENETGIYKFPLELSTSNLFEVDSMGKVVLKNNH